MKSYFIFFLIVGLGSFSGCVSYNQLVNYESDFPATGLSGLSSLPAIKIQPNDVLGIKVFSSETDLAAPFNITPTSQQESFFNAEVMQLGGYLVDSAGGIDFPVLGRIELNGLSVAEARERIKKELEVHLKDAVVNIRLLNFRVTVSGEVRQPGAFHVVNERISLPEALALAGDLTDYANRKNILLIRESGGQRTIHRINIQSASLFQSEFFYLKQNDLIYVKPLRSKVGAIQDQSTKTVPILVAAGTLAALLIALFN